MIPFKANSSQAQRTNALDNIPIISREEARAIGAIHFFTGKPCRLGHLAKRYVLEGKCVECCALRSAKYQSKHHEEHLSYCKRYSREHYKRNKASQDAKNTKWRKDNPERARTVATKWRDENRDKLRAFHRQWARDNADYRRSQRAQRRQAEGTFTKPDVAQIMRQQKGRCAMPYCRIKLDAYHVDHIVPLSRGGSNWPKNLQLLCITCNSSKGARDPIEHARIKGLLL